MQATSKIKVAIIPFKKGNESATVCGDGNRFAAMRNGDHRSFTSLWWAVEYLFEHGFTYDWDSIKVYAAESFECLCRPRGFSFRRLGCSWYFYRDGVMVHAANTLWEGQFMCVRDCYTHKF